MAHETTDMPVPIRRPGLRHNLRALGGATPAYTTLLLVDSLIMVSELTLGVILPWWIASSGGASAVALYSAAIAVATLVAMPMAAPLSDRYCKARQIQWGTAVVAAAAAAHVILAATDTFQLPVLVALGFVQVGALSLIHI